MLIGDLLVIASLGIALAWILMNKQLMERNSHVVVTVYGLLLGTAMLAVWVPLRYGPPPFARVSMKAWLALAASGVLCTATTTLLWNWGMTQVPASQAGVLLNLEPLMGSLLGVLVLGERLGTSAWIGGGLILAAAVTLTTKSKTRVREDCRLLSGRCYCGVMMPPTGRLVGRAGAKVHGCGDAVENLRPDAD